MGMFDTYEPCQKLKDIITKETGIDTFNWQTKSLDCELLNLNINEDLKVTNKNESYLFTTDPFIDSPYIDKGLLFLEFVDDKLKSILFMHNPIDVDGNVEIPDILIEFKNIDSYKCTYINNFDYKCKELIKRNYIYNLYWFD